LVTGEKIWSYLQALGQLLHDVGMSLGGPGLFLIALADSSFVSLPESNDLLIVVLSTGATWGGMSYFVLMTVMGSVVGCTLLYLVGRRGGNFVARRLKQDRLERVSATYRRWGVWAILIPSILPPPTPFKAFVLSAGVFQVPLNRFLFAVFVGRTIRYAMWGILAVLYGEWAKDFLEHNIHSVGLILLLVILGGILSYFVLRYFRGRPEQEEAA
jgi:membrane protein DedA with SNARE-associated domain